MCLLHAAVDTKLTARAVGEKSVVLLSIPTKASLTKERAAATAGFKTYNCIYEFYDSFSTRLTARPTLSINRSVFI